MDSDEGEAWMVVRVYSTVVRVYRMVLRVYNSEGESLDGNKDKN